VRGARRGLLLCAALFSAAASGASAPAPAHACGDGEVAADLQTVAADLDPRARDTLARIDGLGRQLLAARSYLRAGPGLAARWSWTAAQITAYQGSAEYRALRAEIAAVTRRFEALNPGYTLYANLEARSVDLQLTRWNQNASVTRAAETLRTAAVADRCRDSDLTTTPARLRRFLVDWRPPALPTLAAPGLSLHGQLRAFDVQVKQGDRIVAGPDSSTIASVWTAQGWTRKLRTAVRSASTALRGPLEYPDEPWHYVYEPTPREDE
jgi:hypothetical protein